MATKAQSPLQTCDPGAGQGLAHDISCAYIATMLSKPCSASFVLWDRDRLEAVPVPRDHEASWTVLSECGLGDLPWRRSGRSSASQRLVHPDDLFSSQLARGPTGGTPDERKKE